MYIDIHCLNILTGSKISILLTGVGGGGGGMLFIITQTVKVPIQQMNKSMVTFESWLVSLIKSVYTNKQESDDITREH